MMTLFFGKLLVGAAKEYMRDKDIRDVAQATEGSIGSDKTYNDILKECQKERRRRMKYEENTIIGR